MFIFAIYFILFFLQGIWEKKVSTWSSIRRTKKHSRKAKSRTLTVAKWKSKRRDRTGEEKRRITSVAGISQQFYYGKFFNFPTKYFSILSSFYFKERYVSSYPFAI